MKKIHLSEFEKIRYNIGEGQRKRRKGESTNRATHNERYEEGEIEKMRREETLMGESAIIERFFF